MKRLRIQLLNLKGSRVMLKGIMELGRICSEVLSMTVDLCLCLEFTFPTWDNWCSLWEFGGGADFVICRLVTVVSWQSHNALRTFGPSRVPCEFWNPVVLSGTETWDGSALFPLVALASGVHALVPAPAGSGWPQGAHRIGQEWWRGSWGWEGPSWVSSSKGGHLLCHEDTQAALWRGHVGWTWGPDFAEKPRDGWETVGGLSRFDLSPAQNRGTMFLGLCKGARTDLSGKYKWLEDHSLWPYGLPPAHSSPSRLSALVPARRGRDQDPWLGSSGDVLHFPVPQGNFLHVHGGVPWEALLPPSLPPTSRGHTVPPSPPPARPRPHLNRWETKVSCTIGARFHHSEFSHNFFWILRLPCGKGSMLILRLIPKEPLISLQRN